MFLRSLIAIVFLLASTTGLAAKTTSSPPQK